MLFPGLKPRLAVQEVRLVTTMQSSAISEYQHVYYCQKKQVVVM